MVGPERLAKLDVIIAGDDVSRKKPDPEICTERPLELGLPLSSPICPLTSLNLASPSTADNVAAERLGVASSA